VRLQATTHRLTDGSFPVNHPKNYRGYALAQAALAIGEANRTGHLTGTDTDDDRNDDTSVVV